MQALYLDKIINYDGSQLRSHFAFDTTGILGDAVVAFRGGCDVKPEHMVDLVDKNAGCKIYSEDMLHFIIEHFDSDLERMILRQRLFVAIMKDILGEGRSGDGSAATFTRSGNDLFDNDAKLNVSIATASPVSTLAHIGINVSSKNTPVLTRGLCDYDIDPRKFAEEVMNRYLIEIEGVFTARCKVKAVI